MRKNIWICIEKGERNCSAYAPEVPGCATTGATVEETKSLMKEALEFHLSGLMEDGESLENITGKFPTAEVASAHDDEYFILVHIELAAAPAAV